MESKEDIHKHESSLSISCNDEENTKTCQELQNTITELRKENESLRAQQYTPALELLQIPAQVFHYQSALEDDTVISLLEIQRVWEKLIIWREEMFVAMNEIQEVKMPWTKHTSALEIIAEQFASVDLLGQSLCETLWKTIGNCCDVKKVPMTLFKECLIIIEETDAEFDPASPKRIVRSAMVQIHFAGEDGIFKYDSMLIRAKEELVVAIETQCRKTLASLLAARRRPTSEMMHEEGQLMKTFYLLGDAISSSIADGQKLSDYFHKSVAKVLTKQLETLSATAVDLDVYRTFRVIAWIEMCQKDVKTLGMKNVLSALEQAEQTFTGAYLLVIQKQVQDACSQLVRSSYDPKPNTSGHLTTESVEELVGYVVQQVKFLRDHLTGRRLREAVHLCCSIFQGRQQHQHDLLIAINNSNLDNLPDGYLEHVCAVVNDNLRIQDSIQDVYTCVEEQLLQDDEREALKHFLRDIGTGFNSVVQEGIRALAFMIFRDLFDPLSILFTDRWVLANAKPIQMSLATMEDYLADISKWCSEVKHYTQVRYVCVDRFIRLYMERLTDPTITFRAEDITQVAERIMEDVDTLQNYIATHTVTCQTPQHNENVVSPTVTPNEELTHVVDLVAQFFAVEDPAYLLPDLAQAFGKATGEMLTRFVALRSDMSASKKTDLLIEVAEWNTWASHNAPSNSRFHAIVATLETSFSSSTVKGAKKRASKILVEGFKKAQASTLLAKAAKAAKKRPSLSIPKRKKSREGSVPAQEK